jgi:hypothetical protein
MSIVFDEYNSRSLNSHRFEWKLMSLQQRPAINASATCLAIGFEQLDFGDSKQEFL